MKKKQVEKRWRGHDNLRLPVSEFTTLCQWLDVDKLYHPVKDYINTLEKALILLIGSPEVDIEILRRVKYLLSDLRNLDREIYEPMEKRSIQLQLK